MRVTRNLGMLLLSIYLILIGLSAFAPVGQLSVLLPWLALFAGIFILVGR